MVCREQTQHVMGGYACISVASHHLGTPWLYLSLSCHLMEICISVALERWTSHRGALGVLDTSQMTYTMPIQVSLTATLHQR